MTRLGYQGLNIVSFKAQNTSNLELKTDTTLRDLRPPAHMFRYQFKICKQLEDYFSKVSYFSDLCKAVLPPLQKRLNNIVKQAVGNPFRDSFDKNTQQDLLLYPPGNLIYYSYYFGFIRYSDNSAYCGELCFGRRQGCGIMYSPDNFMEYIGYFVND